MSGIYNQSEMVNNAIFVGILFLLAIFSYLSLKLGIGEIGTIVPMYSCIFAALLLFSSCLYGLFTQNSIKSVFLGIMLPVVVVLIISISLSMGEMLSTFRAIIFYLIFFLLVMILNGIIGGFAASKDIKVKINRNILMTLLVIYPFVLIFYLIRVSQYV
jgi:hypothetical protein